MIEATDLPAVDRKRELKELQGRIEKLRTEMGAAETNRSEVSDALKTSERAISVASRSLHQLTAQRVELSRTLDELAEKISTTQLALQEHRAQLARIAAHQYMHGDFDLLRLIFDGNDLATIRRQSQYLHYVSRARIALLEQSKASLLRLGELQAETESKRGELVNNESSQRKVRKQLEAERSARSKVLASIAGDIARSRKEIGKLQRDQESLSRLVEKLGRTLAPDARKRQPGRLVEDAADQSLTGLAFRSLKGRLKFPVRGELVSRFGSQRDETGATGKGLFIRTPAQQPVRSVADGVVVFADWFRGFGNLLIVDHGSGYMSLYGNNESILKQVGQSVQSGETVSTAGDTGGAGDSGVYFELRYQGKPFDPMPWIRR